MNSALTAVTRPRISSGVPSCTSVMRITTLTMSDAPSTTSAISATMNELDSANTMVESPNAATAANMMRPALRSNDQRVSTIAMPSAPTAGAARNRPSAHGPAAWMSRANTGSSAVAPPSSTANRSSEIAPRMIGLRLMKPKPAKNVASVNGSRCGVARSMRTKVTSTPASTNSAQHRL